jgi:predicted MFS family arabinose efflux permease
VTTTIACRLPPKSRTRYWPGIVAVALTTTVTAMPGFTVGALAPAIEQDLHVSHTAIGLMISGFYAATAVGVSSRMRAGWSWPESCWRTSIPR